MCVCVCVAWRIVGFHTCRFGLGAMNGLQLITAAQRAAAAEILNRVREEVATRNAMSMRGA